jgi:signal transduction histidine kinase/CheY-like chemotaxis protein
VSAHPESIPEIEFRVLVRGATARDDSMTVRELLRAGIDAQACASVDELRREVFRGCGAVLLAEECLPDPATTHLLRAIAGQEPWSDLQLLVLARQGADSMVIAQAMSLGANLAVLERPMRVAALITAVRTALRARRRQYEMRDLLDSLNLADQRKTEFLATLAHELRNPLAPISNCVGLLQRGVPDQAPLLRVMERQLHHMIRLVDDLLELSRITRGKVELRMEDLDLHRVVDAALETSRPLIEKGHHRLALRLRDEPLCVRGDPVRLAQVLSNLLNNAARYTDDGGEISVEAHAEGGEAVLAVSDNGSGLTQDALTGVFDMFTQADASDTRAQHGLGIGLALVRNLVEMHGGVVTADSQGPGLGSRFEVRLPLIPSNRLSTPDRMPFAGSTVARRILVVDDNRDAADTLSHLLNQIGATVKVAYNGPDALNLVESFDPDVLVLDLGMPGMSGLDVARQVRKRPGHQPTLVALTGWGQSADRELTRVAGFRHHLTKPVDFAEMHALLQKMGSE